MSTSTEETENSSTIEIPCYEPSRLWRNMTLVDLVKGYHKYLQHDSTCRLLHAFASYAKCKT
ncbi:hypothetical protein V6Z11_1Z116900 [Gossypium hirsutum]